MCFSLQSMERLEKGMLSPNSVESAPNDHLLSSNDDGQEAPTGESTSDEKLDQREPVISNITHILIAVLRQSTKPGWTSI